MSSALFDDGQVGSVGSLIGSALETCGHYLQSQLLNVFETNLAISMGMLLFVIGGMVAIFYVALGGQYKAGAWFLIGPALFFQTTLVRVPSIGAQWEFGGQGKPYQEVHNAVAFVGSEGNGVDDAVIKDMRVSWFFAIWNDFSSNIIQTFVQILHVDRMRSEVTFVNKVDRYVQFYLLRVTDPNIKRFITLASQNHCAHYFRTMQSLWNPSISDPVKAAQIQPLLEIHGQKVAFGQGDEHRLMKLVTDMGLARAMCDEFEANPATSPFESCPTNGDDPELKETGFNCRDVWRLSIAALRIHGQTLIENLAANEVPNEYDASGNPIDTDDSIYLAKMKLAQKFKQTNYGTEHDGISTANVSDDQAATWMLNELAARLMLDTIRGVQSDISQDGRQPRALTQIVAGRTVNPDVGRNLRLLNDGRQQWWDKGVLYTTALAMPYIQGLVLYWLAAAYPFFAMALVIPGRHLGFATWLGLWFWAKSWDLGFAIVMIVDELLYALFPHGPPVQTEDLVTDGTGPDETDAVMSQVLSVDPLHSISMYYHLVGSCMIAVPVITGIMVKRAGSEIISAVNQGLNNFGGAGEQSMAAFYGSMRAQQARGQAQRLQVNAALNAGMQSLANNANVQHHMAAAMELDRRASMVENGFKGMSSAEKRALATSVGDLLTQNKMVDAAAKVTGGWSSQAKNIVAGVLRAKADQHWNIGMAHIKRDMAYARWHESMSEENRRLANDAIALRYYSHDFTPEPPYQAEKDLLMARNFCDIASVADKWITPWYLNGDKLLDVVEDKLVKGMKTGADYMTNKGKDPMTDAEIKARGRSNLGGNTEQAIPDIRTTDPRNRSNN